MPEFAPLGWPQPPYTMFRGGAPEVLERDGYLVVPNPHPEPGSQRLIVECLVRLQADHRLVMRPVVMADGRDGLLVADSAVWGSLEQAA